MNKYQRALKRLRKVYLNNESKDCDILEKLVELGTPKKPLNIYDENESLKDKHFYEKALQGECPCCQREVQPGMEYCSSCGQKLDWSDIE